MIERITVVMALLCLAGSCGSPALAAPADGGERSTPAKAPARTEPAAPADKTAGDSAKAACACDPAELTVMTALRARQKQLDERERKVVEHEAVLGRIEAELSGRLQAAVSDVRRLEEQATAKVGGPCPKDTPKDQPRGNEAVSSALASLSPRKAAAILAAADGAVATQLLNELGPEKSAAILSTMEPTAAAGLVQRMTRRPPEPEPVTPPVPAPTRRGRGGKEGR